MDKWDRRFIDLAYHISSWSSCIREGRQVGAIIVKDKRILSTGYNGAPAGIKSCKDKDMCLRDHLHIESGTRHEICQAVHAEQNAIIQAAKFGISLQDSVLYCTHQPCSICMKMIINAGIKTVIYDQGYPDEMTVDLADEAGITLLQEFHLDEMVEDMKTKLTAATDEYFTNSNPFAKSSIGVVATSLDISGNE